jgi:hypothetical protein
MKPQYTISCPAPMIIHIEKAKANRLTSKAAVVFVFENSVAVLARTIKKETVVNK